MSKEKVEKGKGRKNKLGVKTISEFKKCDQNILAFKNIFVINFLRQKN